MTESFRSTVIARIDAIEPLIQETARLARQAHEEGQPSGIIQALSGLHTAMEADCDVGSVRHQEVLQSLARIAVVLEKDVETRATQHAEMMTELRAIKTKINSGISVKLL